MIETLSKKIKEIFKNIKDNILGIIVKKTIKIFEILSNLIINISVWLLVVLSFVIYKNIKISLTSLTKFKIAGGFLTIIVFISNFFQNQTVDSENIDNYYLGYNIKKQNLYDNFWVKIFSNIRLKLLLCIVVIFPFILLISEFNFKWEIINWIIKIVRKGNEYIESIWLASLIIVSLNYIAVFIEASNLVRIDFSKVYLYKSTNDQEKYNIETKLSNYFTKEFNKIFNTLFTRRAINNISNKATNMTKFIINKSNEYCTSNFERMKYCKIAFNCERDSIEKLVNNISVCENDNKESIIKIKIFEDNLKLIKYYYNSKWNCLKNLDVLPTLFIKLCVRDLNMLLKIEKKFKDNKTYRDIMWTSRNAEIRTPDWVQNDVQINLNIFRIVEELNKRFRFSDFLSKLNEMDETIEQHEELDSKKEIVKLLDVLNEIDNLTEQTKYFFELFDAIFSSNNNKVYFEKLIKYMCDKNVRRNFSEDFNKKLVLAIKQALTNGDTFSNETLRMLLSFLELQDIIIVLIFNLAYSCHRNKKLMSEDEFEIWKNAIEESELKNNMKDLKKSGFEIQLYKEISSLYYSGYLKKRFLKWLWYSLFDSFTEKEYDEFINFEKNGEKVDFSLSAYILLRLLLCDGFNKKISESLFNKTTLNKITEDLFEIKDILEKKDIYLWN